MKMINRENINILLLIIQIPMLFFLPSLDKVNTPYGIVTYGIFAIISVVFVCFYFYDNKVKFNWCTIIVSMFFILCIVSSIVGIVNGNSIQGAVRGILPFCWYTYVLAFNNDEFLKQSKVIIAMLAFVSLMYSLRIILYYISYIIVGGGERVTLYLSSAISTMVLIGILIFAYYFIVNNKKKKWIAYSCMCICYLSMSLTFTKAMIIASIIGVISLLILIGVVLLTTKEKKFIFTWKAFITSCFLLILAIIIITTYSIMFTGAGERWKAAANVNVSEDVDGSISPRITEIEVAIEKFKESPIIGKGLGYKWNSSKLEYADNIIYMHNIIAFLLLDFGAIGILFLILLICVVLRAYYNIMKNNDECSGHSLVISALSLSVIIMLFVYSNFFAVFRNIDFTLVVTIFMSIIGVTATKIMRRE